MKRRILVTAISGDIGNGIVKILHDLPETILFGCDVNHYAVGMDLVDSFWQCKYAIENGYIEELLDKCDEFNITHLIPTNEREIEIISNDRNKFEERGIKLVIQSQYILDICLDKKKTMEFLAKNGIHIPPTYGITVDAVESNVKYIVKPRKSNGSKGMKTLYGKDLRDDTFSDEFLLQEFFENCKEYTAGVFRQKDTINTIIFERTLKNGYSNSVNLINNDIISETCKRIAELIDLFGYINVQLIEKNGCYHILEINPRISGTVRFRHMLEFADVIWWLNALDGETTPKYICKYSKAVGLRELNEKYVVLE